MSPVNRLGPPGKSKKMEEKALSCVTMDEILLPSWGPETRTFFIGSSSIYLSKVYPVLYVRDTEMGDSLALPLF